MIHSLEQYFSSHLLVLELTGCLCGVAMVPPAQNVNTQQREHFFINISLQVVYLLSKVDWCSSEYQKELPTGERKRLHDSVSYKEKNDKLTDRCMN